MTRKHGCYNRPPFKTELTVNNGSRIVGHTRHQEVKTIPFVMSMDCQHPEKGSDPGCTGCSHLGVKRNEP